jgi:alpha-D-ribose 1-methylphosphonate 5-triphosphate diphosphatase
VIAYRAERMPVQGTTRHGWWLAVEEGTIVSVGPEPPANGSRIELDGLDLLPGIVDLHSDCFEELAHPRPSAELPISATFLEYDALVVGWGITTNFLCLNLDNDARKWRTTERALETEATLRRMRAALRADHRIHLRIDVTADMDAVMRGLVAGGCVSLLSYMDHTPGAGQYATEEAWRKNYGRYQTSDELDRLLQTKRAGQSRKEAMRRAVAALARDIEAALASHDDDSAESIDVARLLGVRIAEFPVNEAAARAARAAGLGILMGAPNARRGSSHVDNLSARRALEIGVLDALTSDYHPPSLLAGAYALAGATCTWEDAVGLITSGPAAIAGLDDRGRLEPGARADLVAVDPTAAGPVVRQTWIAGVPAFGPGPRAKEAHAV